MAHQLFSSADLELINSLGKQYRLGKRAIVLFVVILAGLSLPLLFFLEKNYRSFITEIKANNHHVLEKMSIQTSSDLNVLMSDILQLSDTFDTKELNQANTRWIADQLMQLAQYRIHYDQLRFIDADGNERVRIDRDSDQIQLQPKTILQNKSHRYYFTETLSLADGQVYVSGIDFNRENGRIEIPHKMTLRMAAVVRNRSSGEKAGIIVINYLPAHLFGESWGDLGLGGAFQIVDTYGNQIINESNITSWRIRSASTQEKPEALLDRAGPRAITLHQGSQLTSMVKVRFPFLNTPSKSTHWLFIKETDLPNRIVHWFHEKRGLALYGLCAIVLSSALIAWLLARNRVDRLKQNTLKDITHACVGQSPNAIIIADAQQRIVYVNQAFTDLTGYHFETVRGKTPAFLKSNLTPEDTYIALREQLEKDGTWHGEFINKNANNEFFWCKASLCAIYLNNSPQKIYICIGSDITSLKDSEKKLQYQATHDALTDLGNRSYLFSCMNNQLIGNHQASCLMIDIDLFKSVNDTYGHRLGDHVIKTVAAYIAHHVRKTDIVARYGGEEFIVILPETPEDDALEIAESLRTGVEQLRFDDQKHSLNELHITISIGGCVQTQFRGDADFENMIHRADLALYHAKRTGRNRVSSYTSDLEPPTKSI